MNFQFEILMPKGCVVAATSDIFGYQSVVAVNTTFGFFYNHSNNFKNNYLTNKIIENQLNFAGSKRFRTENLIYICLLDTYSGDSNTRKGYLFCIRVRDCKGKGFTSVPEDRHRIARRLAKRIPGKYNCQKSEIKNLKQKGRKMDVIKSRCLDRRTRMDKKSELKKRWISQVTDFGKEALTTYVDVEDNFQVYSLFTGPLYDTPLKSITTSNLLRQLFSYRSQLRKMKKEIEERGYDFKCFLVFSLTKMRSMKMNYFTCLRWFYFRSLVDFTEYMLRGGSIFNLINQNRDVNSDRFFRLIGFSVHARSETNYHSIKTLQNL